MILSGKKAAGGVATGRIYVHNINFLIPVEHFTGVGEEQSHLDRYLSVKEEAQQELDRIIANIQKEDPDKALIFIAHKEIVDDIIINEEIPSKIMKEHLSGDWAIYHVYDTFLAALRKTSDSHIAERAVDFDDVRAMLLRLWNGKKNEGLSSLQESVIIAAGELLPTDTANMDKNKVLAVITEKGGITSHTAIIAKSFGIPAVFGVEGLLDIVKQGQFAIVDADEGKVILDPDVDTTVEYNKKQEIFLKNRKENEKWLYKKGQTSCGVKIDIGLNIANTDAELEAADFADYAGLFRTEFLFMGRNDLPEEDEQFDVYRKVLECFDGRPVMLRTLDIGGDKKLSSLEFEQEENPFLGNRALRFCFGHPDIFRTQIRAALRASVYGNLWLMFPMVTSLEDIKKAKIFIDEARKDLKKKKAPFGEIKIGIMIEVPSIALIADKAAFEVDFASIGSNDLCQYLCAADRMNSTVEDYYQSYHPAMFSLLSGIVSSFSKAGKPVSICGELGCDEKAVPALIGLGFRKFSMGYATVASVKKAISSVSLEKCEEIAGKVLGCATASEIKEIFASS
ncbi:MAG: phosphoenolpyruvate--protein phosphotransferase [Treponema sp.]|nr:phosphoenolpyruvate--protein phosphotransferase [Treponema sp.]MCL2272105.1 phosphoenolpyruvate--protein phosphotransferase [Treponema sp.]